MYCCTPIDSNRIDIFVKMLTQCTIVISKRLIYSVTNWYNEFEGVLPVHNKVDNLPHYKEACWVGQIFCESQNNTKTWQFAILCIYYVFKRQWLYMDWVLNYIESLQHTDLQTHLQKPWSIQCTDRWFLFLETSKSICNWIYCFNISQINFL